MESNNVTAMIDGISDTNRSVLRIPPGVHRLRHLPSRLDVPSHAAVVDLGLLIAVVNIDKDRQSDRRTLNQVPRPLGHQRGKLLGNRCDCRNKQYFAKGRQSYNHRLRSSHPHVCQRKFISKQSVDM